MFQITSAILLIVVSILLYDKFRKRCKHDYKYFISDVGIKLNCFDNCSYRWSYRFSVKGICHICKKEHVKIYRTKIYNDRSYAECQGKILLENIKKIYGIED